MNPWTMVGMGAALVALIFYSVGSIGIFRARHATSGGARALWIGFVFDVLTTTAMAINFGGLDLTSEGIGHTIAGFLAMFAMLAAAIFATMQASKPAAEGVRAGIAKWVLGPWVLWVLVFLYAGISRGGGRG